MRLAVAFNSDSFLSLLAAVLILSVQSASKSVFHFSGLGTGEGDDGQQDSGGVHRVLVDGGTVGRRAEKENRID